MLTGNGAVDTSVHRLVRRVRDELGERRVLTLTDAIRSHEARVDALAGGRRPHDEVLYTRLRELVGER